MVRKDRKGAMIGAVDLAHICLNHHYKNDPSKRGWTLPSSTRWGALVVAFLASIIAFFGFYLLMIAVLPKGPSLCIQCQELLRANSTM